MQSASQRDSIALPRASDSAASPAFGVALRTRPVRPPCTTTPCGCRLGVIVLFVLNLAVCSVFCFKNNEIRICHFCGNASF